MKRNFYLQHPLMAMNDPRMNNLVEQEGLRGWAPTGSSSRSWQCCPNRARTSNI